AGAERPSAIVLDADLEDGCGTDALSRFEAHPATTTTPVHALVRAESSRLTAQLTTSANSSVGYLQKPVEVDTLRESLRSLLDRARAPSRVLVVECETSQDNSLRQVLSMQAIEVTTVGTPADALTALRNTSFSCVIVDLPAEQTTELLRTIAEDDSYSFPNVIVYSGDLLGATQAQELRRYSDAIIVESSRSPERLVDEVCMFLRQVDANLKQQRPAPRSKPIKANDALHGKHVLLVEDDVRNIFALSSALERQ